MAQRMQRTEEASFYIINEKYGHHFHYILNFSLPKSGHDYGALQNMR